jgi:hypothetical protein
MSASRNSIAKKRRLSPYERRVRHRPIGEIERLRTKCDGLEKSNLVLKDENIRLQAQLNFLSASDGLDSEEKAAIHWRRRYALLQLEHQKIEGKLSLAEARIKELEAKITKKDAQIKSLRKKLVSSEKGPLNLGDQDADEQAAGASKSQSTTCAKRARGGQPGTPRPGPRHHDHLPGEENTYGLNESCCEECGEQWEPYTSRSSQQVEITVRAHRRRITKKRYRHFCKKKQRWITKTAAGPKLLFPHSQYGISVWVFLLVARYVLHFAINRICLLLEQNYLYIPQGTIYAGFRRIHKLIKPLIAEIKRYSRENKHHWHIDDTGWKVFVVVDDKSGYGWYLWVFLSDDVCVYILSPSRARKVPKSHLENSVGVVTSDRLSANKKLGDNVENSYCWVHERREFRELALKYPEIAGVCQFFLRLIGSLFHYNAERLLQDADSANSKAEQKLQSTLDQILDTSKKHLADPNLHPELRRVLNGIMKDWEGLKMFLDISSVPLDNNPAERALRGPVVGRKNSYGNHSEWSAEFTADMFSLGETLRLNKINPTEFLTKYLQACAENNGKAPANAAKYLPWHRPPPE